MPDPSDARATSIRSPLPCSTNLLLSYSTPHWGSAMLHPTSRASTGSPTPPRPFVNRDPSAISLIADGQQPGSRRNHWRDRECRGGQDRLHEATKPKGGTTGIDAAERISLAAMVAPIAEHVHEHRPDFTRGSQDPRVIPLCPDRPATTVNAIEPACHSDQKGHEGHVTRTPHRLLRKRYAHGSLGCCIARSCSRTDRGPRRSRRSARSSTPLAVATAVQIWHSESRELGTATQALDACDEVLHHARRAGDQHPDDSRHDHRERVARVDRNLSSEVPTNA
jgi:hypothetical protein